MGTIETSPIEAFESVVSQYQETKYSSGVLQAMQYGKGAEAGKATCTGSSSLIAPTDSDFVVDVENAAKRSLNWAELQYFKEYYKSGQTVVSPGDTEQFQENLTDYPEIAAMDISMRTKLGSRLIAVGIYPLEKYKQPDDVRAPKPGKTRWSHLYGN